MSQTPGPIVIEVEDQTAANPADAPMIMDTPLDAERSPVATVARVAARPVSWLARLFWLGVTTLLMIWLTTATWDFTLNLLERNIWLGRVALVAGGAIALVLVIYALREFASFRRLGSLDAMRTATQDAKTSGNNADATALTNRIAGFYRARPDMAWAMENLNKSDDAVLDPIDRIHLTERTLMPTLDAQAAAHVKSASRQVATATAIVPLPLADVLVALTANLRMVRQIAETYGGRAGGLGSWRLMRAVAVHLVATGAIGIADDMVGSVLGGGLAAKLSRRFGEGIVNGALTARVGIAAMEICRPMPFDAVPRPNASALVRDALTGIFGKSKDADPAKSNT